MSNVYHPIRLGSIREMAKWKTTVETITGNDIQFKTRLKHDGIFMQVLDEIKKGRKDRQEYLGNEMQPMYVELLTDHVSNKCTPNSH